MDFLWQLKVGDYLWMFCFIHTQKKLQFTWILSTHGMQKRVTHFFANQVLACPNKKKLGGKRAPNQCKYDFLELFWIKIIACNNKKKKVTLYSVERKLKRPPLRWKPGGLSCQTPMILLYVSKVCCLKALENWSSFLSNKCYWNSYDDLYVSMVTDNKQAPCSLILHSYSCPFVLYWLHLKV